MLPLQEPGQLFRPVLSFLGGLHLPGRPHRIALFAALSFGSIPGERPQARVRFGYRKIRVLLKREGWKVGKKLLYRLYREEGLTLRYKPKWQRCAARNRRERGKATAPNQVWSLDFVADQLADRRRFP